MRISRSCLAVLSLLPGLACAADAASTEIKIGADRRIRINEDWRFFKGDADGAEQAAFSDAAWRPLDLPHDWAIEGPFDRKFNPHDGGLPFFGVAWYRKHFALPAGAKGKYFSVQFDGAMSNSTVWINGQKVGGRPYGYESFALDLTPYLKFGGENVLAVRLAPGRSILTLVSRGRHLPECVAQRYRSRTRRAMGHLHYDARRHGCQSHRGHPHRSREQGRTGSARHGRDRRFSTPRASRPAAPPVT